MLELANIAIDHVWSKFTSLQNLVTPDDYKGRSFTINVVNQDKIIIVTEGGTSLTIRREAFLEAIRYLVAHGHIDTKPCEIRSNQLAENAGPLCKATRNVNNNTRVINYIVPILVGVGILASGGSRPNTTWLA